MSNEDIIFQDPCDCQSVPVEFCPKCKTFYYKDEKGFNEIDLFNKGIKDDVESIIFYNGIKKIMSVNIDQGIISELKKRNPRGLNLSALLCELMQKYLEDQD